MKRTISLWIAAANVVLIATLLAAAVRPRYGGTLHLQTGSALRSLDPAEIPADPAALAAKAQLIPYVFETLVRLDDNGRPQPWLALSWMHDSPRKRWVFTIRPNVRLHSGAIWNPAGGVIEEADDRPLDQLLRELARPWSAVVVREPDGSLSGTGPFRVSRWEAGKGAILSAHEGYWKGRPYLDSVEIQLGRGLQDQIQNLQLGKTDVIDGGTGAGSTLPDQVIALVFDNPRVSPAAREAVSLAIDRATIRRVLLKDRGEISGALLPQWLSGYSFLFASKRDLGHARQLAAAAPQLSFSYDRQDGVLRSIAERISVNAMEAGIIMRPAAAVADVRLLVLPITSRDEVSALADLATILKAPVPSFAMPAYDAEKALLDGFRVIPLFHLARGWSTARKVENWPDLPNVWVRRP